MPRIQPSAATSAATISSLEVVDVYPADSRCPPPPRLSATADTSIADFARNEIDQLPETDSLSTAATSASEVVRTISTTLSIRSEEHTSELQSLMHNSYA